MPPPSLLSLPAELSLNIVNHLSRHDLARCALVSKDWHAICTPALWRVITISDPVTFHRFSPEEMQQALTKNAHHIRDLETCYLGVIKWIVKRSKFDVQLSSTTVLADETPPLFSLCKNLTRLNLGNWSNSLTIQDPALPQSTLRSGRHQFVGFGPTTFGTPLRSHMNDDEEELVIHLIQSNIHLRTLSITPVFNKMHDFLSSLSEAHLPDLQDLVIHSPFNPTRQSPVAAHTLKRFIENLSKTIRSININFLVDKTCVLDADLGYSCQKHSLLERLAIRMDLTGMEEFVLLEFFKSCSKNLRSIQLGECVHLTNERLYREVDRLGLNKELDRGFLNTLPDHILASVVSRSQSWRLIDLRNSNCGVLTLTAIARHCQELEVLYTGDDTTMMSSPELHKILCNATKLLELHANSNCEEGAPQNSQLQALDVISSTWVCQSLKIFKADIVGIPRPDVEFQQDGQPVQGALHTGTVEESHDFQRRVLGQLGALTELEELGLGAFAIDIGNEGAWVEDEEVGGMRYLDRDFQLTCLEMSLASGLDFLAGLKKLRVLDVSRIAHRIGPIELEWMQTNWPRLEQVNGLFNDFYSALVPGVCDWLFEQRPVWGAEYLQETFRYNEERTRGGFFLGE